MAGDGGGGVGGGGGEAEGGCAEISSSDASGAAPRGGFMVVTGFTTTFFTPRLLRTAGLRVHHASLPSAHAGGLETDCGRFHMWVLEVLMPDDDKKPEE